MARLDRMPLPTKHQGELELSTGFGSGRGMLQTDDGLKIHFDRVHVGRPHPNGTTYISFWLGDELPTSMFVESPHIARRIEVETARGVDGFVADRQT